MRQRDPTPAPGIADTAVRRELVPAPQGQDGVACLEEDRLLHIQPDRPAEPLVERPGGRDVPHSEGDQAHALLHDPSHYAGGHTP